MNTDRSLIVADPVFPSTEIETPCPSAESLVTWASAAGADRLAVRAWLGPQGWAVVHPCGASADGAPSLEEVMLAAHRASLGLVVRIAKTDVISSLAGGLGILGSEGPAELRRRYLVVVPSTRIGKWLRRDAGDLPSARELDAGTSIRSRLRRRAPNLARAASDADDLMVSAATTSPQRVRDVLVPQLRRRGAFVWVADVPPEARSSYENLGAGGLLLRLPWDL